MGSFSSCGTHAVACSRGSRTRRQVSLLPLLTLCRSASFQRARGFSFHHAIPGCKVWSGFPRKRVFHSAGFREKLRRFRGIYQYSQIRSVSVPISLSLLVKKASGLTFSWDDPLSFALRWFSSALLPASAVFELRNPRNSPKAGDGRSYILHRPASGRCELWHLLGKGLHARERRRCRPAKNAKGCVG
jgi:hypothetical protein